MKHLRNTLMNKENDDVQIKNTLESLNKKIDFLTSKEDDLSSTFLFISDSFSRLEGKLDKMSHRQSDSQKSFVESIMEKLDYLFFDNQIAKKQLMIEEDVRWCESEISSLKSSIQNTIDQVNHAILLINEKIPKAPKALQ